MEHQPHKETKLVTLFFRKSGSYLLRVNSSTVVLMQTPLLLTLPCHPGSHHLLVSSTFCAFSLSCPYLLTLSVTCPNPAPSPPNTSQAQSFAH